MWTVKSLRSIAGLAGLIVALASAVPTPAVMAQLPPSNPLVAPVPPLPAPSRLPAPGQALAAPVLVPLPPLPVASPTPVTRAFNCSCSGTGEGTSWMGLISAASFFAARQGATGACFAYNERKEPARPVIPTHQTNQFAPTATLPPGFQSPDAAASAGATLPGGLIASTAAQRQACAHCVCD